MSKRPEKHEDDDGRTVADMSGVTRPNLWSFRFPSTAPWYSSQGKASAQEGEQNDAADKPDPFRQMTRGETRSFIFAAVASALGIAAVYGVVFLIAILIIGHASC